jgi:transposase-like protein
VKLTLLKIADLCRTEADAYALLEELRWHGTPVCPHCGNDEKVYFLTPKNGETRATGPKRTMSARRVWKCAKCRKQFSVLTGTIFHGTKISLRVWLLVLAQFASAKNGISAREVARMHEITEESAWHMVHRIREALKREPVVGMFSGHVVADETFMGGKRRTSTSRASRALLASVAVAVPRTARRQCSRWSITTPARFAHTSSRT